MAWEQANQESDTTYGRGLTQNQMDWERLVGATGMDYSKALQQNQDTAGRNFQQWQANTQNQMGQRQQNWNERAGLAGIGQTANTYARQSRRSTLGQAQAE